MFSRKKKEVAPPPPRKGGGNKLMAQMGIVDDKDMASMEADIYGDDDDAELEAELAMLAGEDAPKAKTSPTKGPMSMNDLNKMVVNSMNYIPDSDDDHSEDVDDPELLAELQLLSTDSGSPEHPVPEVLPPAASPNSSVAMVTMLQDRLSLYQVALQNAKAANDSSKTRRLDRGRKTLHDLLRRAQSGKQVQEEDIPPAVSTSVHPTPVSSPMKEQSTFPPPPKIMRTSDTGKSSVLDTNADGTQASVGQKSPVRQMSPLRAQPTLQPPVVGPPPETGDKRELLTGRRDQYRHAALAAKKGGDNTKARNYIKTAKQFDLVIKALDEGKPVDLSQMPPPPPDTGGGIPTRMVTQPHGQSAGPSQAELANAAVAALAKRVSPPQLQSPEEEEERVPELAVEDKKKLFNAPQEATSILEAMEQRLERYRSSCAQAKEEGNSSKARRMGRIVKQYEDAIKAHKAGHHVDYSDLPTIPGFPPIPCDSPAKQSPQTPSPAISPSPSNTQLSPIAPPPAARLPQRVPAATQSAPAAPRLPVAPPPAAAASVPRPGLQKQHSVLSRAEQQGMFLQERQLMFKKEALKAKQKGDMELAKKYMRQAMGFDQMIEASKSGLPVDMSQVPSLPGMSAEKLEFISSDDAKQGDRAEIYKNLQQELISQIRTCMNNSEHFTKLGDVATAEKFNNIYKNAQKDLESLKDAFKHGDPVPRYHYETRTYTLVKSCSDLGDDELQVLVVRGINYHLPSDYTSDDLDTYIKYELPFPSEDVQKGYSDTVKGTNNPEYNQSFNLSVSRKSRSFLRFLKHKTLKIEVYYKRGFFKGDKLLGFTQIKLLPLENACVVHESYDLTEGRRAVGGKLEVKLRVREPFLGKQVEEVTEKWLLIDHFDRVLPSTKAAITAVSSGSKAPKPPRASPPVASIKVLEYEKLLLDRQIQQMAGRLSRVNEDGMRRKSAELGQRRDEQREQLKREGVNGLKVYTSAIEQTMAGYLAEANTLKKQGNQEKARMLLMKQEIIKKEVEAIRSKYPIR